MILPLAIVIANRKEEVMDDLQNKIIEQVHNNALHKTFISTHIDSHKPFILEHFAIILSNMGRIICYNIKYNDEIDN